MGLLAHVDAGKTTLSERFLYESGRIRKMGRVDKGDTLLDDHELERARGITIFVTTHYMDEAEYCNRVSIMVDGKIEALDSPSALKRDFKTTNMNQVFYALARKATRGQ